VADGGGGTCVSISYSKYKVTCLTGEVSRSIST